MLAFLLAAGGIIGGLQSGKMAAQAVSTAFIGSTQYKLMKSKAEIRSMEELMEMNINPKRNSKKNRRMYEAALKLAEQTGSEVPRPEQVYDPDLGWCRFTLPEEELPAKLVWLAGEYMLTQEEATFFFMGMRSLEILYRVGEGAELERLAAEKGISYDVFLELFGGFKVDFDQYREDSKQRLANPKMKDAMRQAEQNT